MSEIKEIVSFKNINFIRYPDSKRRSERVYFHGWIKINGDRKKERLHRVIWMEYNGSIPDGYHIHHKDGNPLNNDISNLECKSGKDHIAEHHHNLPDSTKEYKKRILLTLAQEKAKAWHGTEEGKEWHREHALKVLEDIKQEKDCIECGIKYFGIPISKFCSAKCKNRYHVRIDREEGRYNEIRKCKCGNSFSVYKWSKTKNCSKSCAKRIHWNI